MHRLNYTLPISPGKHLADKSSYRSITGLMRRLVLVDSRIIMHTDRSTPRCNAWAHDMNDSLSPFGLNLSDPREIRNMPPMSPGGYQRYREMTIDDMLLENRVIFLVGEINYSSATAVIMRMLYLANQKKDQDINLYINSPGGGVDDTLAIYDTMNYLPCKVATYCIGRAMSGGAIILTAGAKGKRHILPHAKVMIHQPYGGVYGQAADVKIQAEEILRTKKELIGLLAKLTGQTEERVAEDSERDKYFSAAEAKAYGLVDEVLAEVPQEKK
jgi:ATP-dependent Clp protease protease subunit